MPGRVKGEQPGIRDVGIGPALMIGTTVPACGPFVLLAQQGSQPSARALIELDDGISMSLLDVAKPASQRPVEIDDHGVEALTSRASGLVADRILELGQALLAHMPLPGLEPGTEDLEPLARNAAAAGMRFPWMRRQPVLGHPGPGPGEGGVSLRDRHGMTKSPA